MKFLLLACLLLFTVVCCDASKAAKAFKKRAPVRDCTVGELEDCDRDRPDCHKAVCRVDNSDSPVCTYPADPAQRGDGCTVVDANPGNAECVEGGGGGCTCRGASCRPPVDGGPSGCGGSGPPCVAPNYCNVNECCDPTTCNLVDCSLEGGTCCNGVCIGGGGPPTIVP